MSINRERVRQRLQDFNFKTLFIEEMGWLRPASPRPVPMQIDGVSFARQQIAHLSGIGVFEICPTGATERKIPDAKVRRAVHAEIEQIAHENLIIFLDDDQTRTQSLWYWVKREGSKKMPREHYYFRGQPGDLFLSKLDALVVEMDELRPDGTLPITDAARKLTSALDIERVTKKFYTEFSDLRAQFVLLIQGIDKEADRNWYASVLLNRLMFIYFLQKKGFIQNNGHYLEDKLAAYLPSPLTPLPQGEGIWPSPLTPLPQGEENQSPLPLAGEGGQGVEGKTLAYTPPPLTEAARRLRQEQTDAEALLWECLKDRQFMGLKFRRQHPIKGTPYIADFYCNEHELILELDGGIHRTQVRQDRDRQTALEGRGYKVLRFTNQQVFRDLENVLRAVEEKTRPSPLTPLPQGEGIWPSPLTPLPQGEGNKYPLPLAGEGGQGVEGYRFYSEFLAALFFEGFAKPDGQRSAEAKALLGPIKYLNGGLFIRHTLEEKYPGIAVPDEAFRHVLTLFSRYSWHLDDTPGAADNEINPDVLGAIFEKYINQKAFGAYYTRTEITEYLCERTIHAAILDRLNAEGKRPYAHLGDAIISKHPDTVRLLLNAVLPRLSILDPACGSGAFLVAAMKTLVAIYGALYGQVEALNDPNLRNDLRAIDSGHPSRYYYIRKRIITDNLFGVDIMQEATEIARLRLFLSLVASVNRVDDLEPLPNIDFNIMAGNSLIGLLAVDEDRFSRANLRRAAPTGTLRQGNLIPREEQTDFLGMLQAQRYRDLLTEKNRLVAQYRAASSLTENLHDLRNRIAAMKQGHYAALNDLLLEDFQALGIKYEEALTPSPSPAGRGETALTPGLSPAGRGETALTPGPSPAGRGEGRRTKKRPLTAADLTALTPFHWGYEFDEIMGVRGGFDVIITNPPWEVFQTDEKEFLQQYDKLIQKKKIDIKTWEKQRDQMLQDPEIMRAWLEYCSGYPHVSAYFKNAPQYKHQQAEVNGKSAARKINLYLLFTEQCYNLLRRDGLCGTVIPSGIYTDLGAKGLREMLFAETQIAGLFGFENRKTIFEGVDSRFKFVVLTFRRGGKTTRFPAAFMRLNVNDLRGFPSPNEMQVSVPMVQRMSPDSLSIMEFKQDLDIQIAEKMLKFPLLGEEVPGAWKLSLTQELNMTSDSHLFHKERKPGMLPLYEGKMIHQFTHQWEGASVRYWVDEKEGRKALIGKKGKDTGQRLDYQGYRLGFRDVARNTDQRTMIMTMLPPNIFLSHPLPMAHALRDGKPDYVAELFVCTVMNSFVLDFAFRQRVTAHLTFFYIQQMGFPRYSSNDPYFAPLVERAARLICTTPEFDDLAREVALTPNPSPAAALGAGSRYGVTDAAGRARLRAEIDGMVAHLYGLSEAEFTHILGTFPLVSQEVKEAVLSAYRAAYPLEE